MLYLSKEKSVVYSTFWGPKMKPHSASLSGGCMLAPATAPLLHKINAEKAAFAAFIAGLFLGFIWS